MTDQERIQRLENQVQALRVALQQTIMIAEEIVDSVEPHATFDGMNGKVSRTQRLQQQRLALSSLLPPKRA